MKEAITKRPARIFNPNSPSSGVLVLDEGNAHYLANVLRIAPGEILETFDGEGTIEVWEVSHVSSKEIRAVMVGNRKVTPKAPVNLILGLNPLKGGNEEPAVRMAAAMEVREIVPVFFRRSEVPIDFDRLERRLERWRRFCIAEVILTGGAYLPRIQKPTTLSMFLDGRTDGVLFDESADPSSAGEIHFKPGSTVVALVGPEGGVDRKEVELAVKSGFKIGSLGPWTLRAELAGALVPYWVYSKVKNPMDT